MNHPRNQCEITKELESPNLDFITIFFLFLKNGFFIWPFQVFAAARRIFLVVTCEILIVACRI